MKQWITNKLEQYNKKKWLKTINKEYDKYCHSMHCMVSQEELLSVLLVKYFQTFGEDLRKSQPFCEVYNESFATVQFLLKEIE